MQQPSTVFILCACSLMAVHYACIRSHAGGRSHHTVYISAILFLLQLCADNENMHNIVFASTMCIHHLRKLRMACLPTNVHQHLAYVCSGTLVCTCAVSVRTHVQYCKSAEFLFCSLICLPFCQRANICRLHCLHCNNYCVNLQFCVRLHLIAVIDVLAGILHLSAAVIVPCLA
jgi:hypothetical protein